MYQNKLFILLTKLNSAQAKQDFSSNRNLYFLSKCPFCSYIWNYSYGYFWVEQKAWLKINIFAIHSAFLLLSFVMREEKRGKRITKVVILSHTFLLDHFLENPWEIKCFFSYFLNVIRLNWNTNSKLKKYYMLKNKD